MNSRTRHCDDHRLELLLANQLTEPEQNDVAQHIEGCVACRTQLECLAGSTEWWSDVSDFLRPHTLDRHETKGRATTPTQLLSTDDIGPVEFSLDFLERSDNPAMIGRLSDYEILALIGRGGMGVVLKGYQPELNRYVAVKVMAPHYACSGSARKRFAREAQAAAAVVHPHVVAIHSVDAKAKLPYLVMPFVAARSLQDRIDRDGPLELKEVLRIGKQAAEGLAAAHTQGLVHRDIKPANILLEDDVGRVLLTDFGLARTVDDATMTRSGVIAGTPQYMSPEQACGEVVNHQTDLFSLGSVIYAMCAGHPPFRAETTMGVLRRICEETPRPLREVNSEVPDWLSQIVGKLHAKDPADRYTTSTEVADLLAHCLAHVQQPMAVPLADSLAKKRAFGWRAILDVRHRRMLAGIGCGLLAAAVVALVATATSLWHPTTPAVKNVPAPHSSATTASQATAGASAPSPDEPPSHWNDGVDQQIFLLDDASANLARQTEHFWEESTQITTRIDQRRNLPPSPEETNP